MVLNVTNDFSLAFRDFELSFLFCFYPLIFLQKKFQQQLSEKKIALLCRQDEIRENTIRQIKEENLHRFCNRWENLAEEKRFNHRLALEAKERELEEDLECVRFCCYIYFI